MNVELSENDLMLLRTLLMQKIEYGGQLCEMKRCIYLFEKFKSVENSVNE